VQPRLGVDVIPGLDRDRDSTSTSTSTATATATSTATTTATTPSPDALAPAPDLPADMLLVPAGPFTMGADKGGEEDEHPAHNRHARRLPPRQNEVSHEQYDACVAASILQSQIPNHRPLLPRLRAPEAPRQRRGMERRQDLLHVETETPPREAEFEKAVRGTDARRYPWGAEPPTPERTVFGRALGPKQRNRPTTSARIARARPYGHDDLAGNLWEWMEDEYDPFAYARAGAPEGKPGTCFEIIVAQDKLRKEGRQGFTGSIRFRRSASTSIRGRPSLRSLSCATMISKHVPGLPSGAPARAYAKRIVFVFPSTPRGCPRDRRGRTDRARADACRRRSVDCPLFGPSARPKTVRSGVGGSAPHG